jgi:predicted GNAT family N-acyltransferase
VSQFEIEPLSDRHDRGSFDCGVEVLNRFLKQFAFQNQKKHFVRTYVCCSADNVIGYYSLTFGSMKQENVPSQLVRGMGKYEVPAIILGRLAIDKSHHGKRLGAELLRDAVTRAKQAELIAGLRMIIVHAKDSRIQEFYQKYGFLSLPDAPLQTFEDKALLAP